MSDLESLKKDVLKAGGMTSGITMWGLRSACGFERLGKNVPDAVSQKLHAAGIGHIPTVLSQKTITVRIYIVASPIGQLIESVLTPNADNDENLLVLVDGAAKKLAQIKEILGT